MSDFDTFTDYRCLNGHIFSVPWGDESPRSTVVCPRCGATSFVHTPERSASVSPSSAPGGKGAMTRELYHAIVEAEAACKRAHDLCYVDGGKHGAGYWLATRLGKAQSILMHYVVKYAGRYQPYA